MTKAPWQDPREILVLLNPRAMQKQKHKVRRLLEEGLPGARVHFASSPEEVEQGQRVHAVIAPTLDWLPDALDRAPGAKWIHFLGSGVDSIWAMGIHQRGLLMTNSAGIHAATIAEWVIGAMLHFVKDFGQYQDQARERKWERTWSRELTGSTLGILGIGHVGKEIARKAQAFDMRIIGTVRNPRPIDNVDKVYPFEETDKVVEQSDYLAITVPLSKSTEGLIDRRRLGMMPKGSYLLHVARGGVVDEEALMEALEKGPLAGAALDVYTQEPLPPTSPLWGIPNLLLSPHIAGTTQFYMERAIKVFLENNAALKKGGEPATIVRPEEGF